MRTSLSGRSRTRELKVPPCTRCGFSTSCPTSTKTGNHSSSLGPTFVTSNPVIAINPFTPALESCILRPDGTNRSRTEQSARVSTESGAVQAARMQSVTGSQPLRRTDTTPRFLPSVCNCRDCACSGNGIDRQPESPLDQQSGPTIASYCVWGRLAGFHDLDPTPHLTRENGTTRTRQDGPGLPGAL